MSIIILDNLTANLIAAGEVVERPASVIKELVENSIDAGSNKIVIELKAGGIDGIRVIDNGSGMDDRDLPLALCRHATSKIKCASDLKQIKTLGFRGEALPSIASVSRMSITSKTRDMINGLKIMADGGLINGVVEPVACPSGTCVQVTNLFFNTPVRLKTLKGKTAEGTICADLVYRLAMARPDVRFELIVDDRKVFISPGTSNLFDSVASVYGAGIIKEMIKVNSIEQGIGIQALIGKPNLSRSTRSHITIIVNGRLIRCASLSDAIIASYGTLIPYKRKPVAVISLSIDENIVDVNVHPSKMEVKFLEQDKITGIVKGVMTGALKNRSVIPSAAASFKEYKKKDRSRTEQDVGHLIIQYKNNNNLRSEEHLNICEKSKESIVSEMSPDSASNMAESASFPVLKALAQLQSVYIIASGEEGLYLIDQHAAHERIIYEKLSKEKSAGQSQILLAPINLEINYSNEALLTKMINWFNEEGFSIENFGGNTFLIRSVPPGVPAGLAKEILFDMMDYYKEMGKFAESVEFSDRLNILLACKNAVKSGEKLSLSAMDELLRQLSQARNSYTCPHGRPTLIHVSFRELDMRFKR